VRATEMEICAALWAHVAWEGLNVLLYEITIHGTIYQIIKLQSHTVNLQNILIVLE